MEPYFFLFVLGGIWLIFATVQDLKTREVANWLTFSLISFGIAFYAFTSLFEQNFAPMAYSVAGGILFVAAAYGFYYGRVFAGGDAKLLMGIGVLWPYQSWSDIIFIGAGFIFLLFLLGAVYSLIYSFFIVIQNEKRRFLLELQRQLFIFWPLFLLCILLSLILLYNTGAALFWIGGTILLISIPLLFSYLQALDITCMRKLIAARNLREGDWLVRDIKVGGKRISASVHGLRPSEIMLLRKHNAKIWIKEGIPFVPAFLLSYLIMVFFLATATIGVQEFVLDFFLS